MTTAQEAFDEAARLLKRIEDQVEPLLIPLAAEWRLLGSELAWGERGEK